MVTALQTDRRQSTEEVLAQLQTRHDASMIVVQKEQEGIPPATLAALDLMTKEELIGLIRRSNAQWLSVALMSEDQIRTAFLDRLAVAGINEPDIVKAMNAMEKRLNRTEGTPLQRTATMLAVTDGTNTFRDILAELDGKSTGLPLIEG